MKRLQQKSRPNQKHYKEKGKLSMTEKALWLNDKIMQMMKLINEMEQRNFLKR
jgi:hypothetical protein